MEENQDQKTKIIKRIKLQLSRKLKGIDGYKITPNVRWGSTSSNQFIDLVVRRNKNLLAFFKIVLEEEYITSSRKLLVNSVYSSFKEYNPPILITYCEENKTYNLVFPIGLFDKLKIEFPDNEYKQIQVISNLNDVISVLEKSSEVLDKPEEKSTSIDPLQFYKSTDQVLDPNWCREKLGEASCKNNESKMIRCDEICRYSSLDSLFSSIKHKTIRMNGLPGMNDKNEGLFAWNMIYKLDNTDNEENKKRRRETNNAFIVSYSSSNLIDDLTQWRLYGDDAKGVCCVYKIDKDKLIDRFFLHNVRYIKESDNSDDISDDLLHLFLEYSKEHSDLRYYDLSPAIFFYKPDSYESEDEIRLLVDNKKTSAYKTPIYKREWVLTNANNIPNPYIDIPLDDFPLKIDRIILGPNMNDVDTIQAQLETMLEQQGINATVELSNIKSYRNPTN